MKLHHATPSGVASSLLGSDMGNGFGVCRLLAACGVLIACGAAPAQGISPADQYKTYLTAAQTIEPGSGFGDQVSLRDGRLSFRNVDIEVPGIGPTIRIIRTAMLDDGLGNLTSSGNNIGGWEIEIPRLKTITAAPDPRMRAAFLSDTSPQGWQVAGATLAERNARCTRYRNPDDVVYENGGPVFEFFASDWWFGYQMMDDTGNEQTVFERASGLENSTTYKIGTASNWVFTCLATTANAAEGAEGEAFLATAPDGTRYWFDYLDYAGYDSLSMDFEISSDGQMYLGTLPRRSASLLVTRVEDRFGNYLTYNYSGGLLTGITASDGRILAISRSSGTMTITVGSGQAARSWTYIATSGYLSRVQLPDGSAWTYSALPYRPYHASYTYAGCDQGTPGTNLQSRQFTVQAPYGASATFNLDQRHFGRSHVPRYCRFPEDLAHSENNFPVIPRRWVGYSMSSKVVTGPGLPTQTWTYAYSDPPNYSWIGDCTSGCASTAYTDVTDPANQRTRSTFSNAYDQTENKLLKEQFYSSTNALLRTVDYEYATASSSGTNPYPWPLKLTTFTNWNSNVESDARWTPLKKRTITQQGMMFKHEVSSSNGYDAFAREIKAADCNTTGTSCPAQPLRTVSTNYHDNLTAWVLGQVATTSVTTAQGTFVPQRTDYDAQDRPIRTYTFNKLQQTLTYNANGTIATSKDANNNITSFSNWKLGIPQLVQYPVTPESNPGATRMATVNDRGWITSTRDETGYTTEYAYDNMGRITQTTYPTADTNAWAPASTLFEQVASTEYGIAAGHWRQTVHTGNAYKVTWFDAFWRPVLVREYDAADVAATDRYTATSYDFAGRPTYVSYSLGTAPSMAADGSWLLLGARPFGVRTTYDALGRPTSAIQDSELGNLTTSTAYLAGFQRRTTDPNGNATTESFQVFDQPSYDAPTQVDAPEHERTTIARDIFGKVTSITRGAY